MQRKNTLVLSWVEVRDLLFARLRDELHEVAAVNELELVHGSVLVLQWDAPPEVRPQLVSEEKIENQSYCTMFNEACAPVLGLMGLEGITIQWLEKFFYCTSFVVRAQDRNGQIFMPEKFGHGVVGPHTGFAQFHQFLLTCLSDKWPVKDTSTRELHERISLLALWVGANSLELFIPFMDEFFAKIQALLEAQCD